MVFSAMTRRDFLTTSAGAVATLAVAAGLGVALADSRPMPTGVVYGRLGRQGIRPGTASAPSRGKVILLDGSVLEASYVTRQGIGAGKSVLLSPDESGGWSILYAEF
jgi:hypothetical protein